MNQPPPIPASPAPKTSGLAVASLILGILAIVLCFIGPVLFGIPAIICGHLASGWIRRSGGAMTGKGLATAGFVTGYVSLALMVLSLPIAIPNFIKARKTAQMNACVNNLRLIDSAKQAWALERGKDATATPMQNDIQPYLGRGPGNPWPLCPAGGTYEIKSIGEPPACTVEGHELPQ